MSSSESLAIFALSTSLAAVVGYGIYWKARAQKLVETAMFPGIPFAPGANWLLGHLIMLNGNSDFRLGHFRVFKEYADPQSGICSFWFASRPTFSILLGHHVKAVLNSSSHRETIKLMDFHHDNFLGKQALTSLMGKEWRLFRSAVHKSFTPGALQQAQCAIHQVGNTLTESLLAKINKDKEGLHSASIQLPLLSLMKMATMDVFGLAVLDNTDFECCRRLQLTEVASAFEHLSSEYTRRVKTPWDVSSWIYSIPTRANRKHREQRVIIRNFIAEQIVATRFKLQNEQAGVGERHDSLLANILRAAAKLEGEPSSSSLSSDQAIGDIVMTLFFGGYDTTSITLSYAIYLLAKHNDIQDRCLHEIQSVLTAENVHDESTIGPDQLPYTRAVILETLRLFPPAPITMRTMEKSMELPQLASRQSPANAIGKQQDVIEKGRGVFVPIWLVQRDARNFPLPEEMRPERWVRPKRKSGTGVSEWEYRPSDDFDSSLEVPPANNDAFCVFSTGARNCVGRKLALQEAVTLLALLLRKLKFELMEPGYQVKPVLSSVVQQPQDGLPMNISAR